MDTKQIDDWLATEKHYPGRMNEKKHGYRGAATMAGATQKLEQLRAEWKGGKGAAIRKRAEKSDTEVYQMRNGEFEVINDRHLPQGRVLANDFSEVERTLSQIEASVRR